MRRILATVLALAVVLGVMTSCIGGGTEIEVRDLCWPVGAPLPRAEDFVIDLPDGCTVRYAEAYSFNAIKNYEIELILTDAGGLESRYGVSLKLIRDEEPPTVDGLRDHVAYLGGDGISYLAGVSTRDNCDGAIDLQVDASAVNLKRIGVYPVIYTATDLAGNVARFRMTVTVSEREITEEMLNPLLDDVIDDIIYKNMTLKQKLRAIYDYVYGHVAYTSIADKSNWISAAYEGLTTGQGDCYTYYALSKAFFERLGIENRDVERKQEAVIKTGERHFWNLVNIGSAKEPSWYHFDACHLNGMAVPWGFLMTDAQLDSYSEYRQSASGVTDYFYAYDQSLHPTVAETVITRIN